MTNHKLFFSTLALFCLSIQSIAHAQDASDPIEPLSNDADLINSTDEDAAADLPDPDDKLYWAKMRDIYTYHKKGVRKEGAFAMSLYSGIIPNNIFEIYIPLGLRFNYYILENVGIELAGSYNFAIKTALTDRLKNKQGIGTADLLLSDQQISHSNIGVVWSPLYGKTAWYDKTINYFDFYLFGGIGLAVLSAKTKFGQKKPETYFKPEGAIGAGIQFFMTENAMLRLDYRQFLFAKSIGGIAIPSEITAAFGWMF